MPKAKINLSGLEEYLEQINRLGDKADEAIKEMLKEGAEPIETEMKRSAAEVSARMANAVDTYEIEQESPNRYAIKIGTDSKAHPDAFFARYWEYGFKGFDGHHYSHPFIFTSLKKKKTRALNNMKSVLKRRLGLD